MTKRHLTCCLLGFCFLQSFQTLRAQTKAIPDQLPQEVKAQLLQRLSPDWQLAVTKYHILDGYNFRYLYARTAPESFQSLWTDDALRYRIMSYLIETPGAENFVLDHLMDPMDPKEHKALYLRIGTDPHGVWSSNDRATSVLKRAALSEPDPEVFMAAFNALHKLEARRLRDVVERRLASDQFMNGEQGGAANEVEKSRLLKEDRKLNLLLDGVHLPEFLLDHPPVFDAKPGTSAIRALIIGDFGTMDKNHENQKKVAAAMLAYNRRKPSDFGMTVGDNFYFRMKSLHDPLWKTDFEDLYGPLGITFYPSFGNHDWDDSMATIELLHSDSSATWKFPAPYYTYTAGPVQFFAMNTGTNPELALDKAQLTWLQEELDKSKARWKIVYGHFPIKDNARGISWSVYDRLMPILKRHADLYISGHMHNFEHLKPESDVNLVVVGSASQAASHEHDFDADATYVKDNTNGFAVLEADDHRLTIRFVDINGNQFYESSWHK